VGTGGGFLARVALQALECQSFSVTFFVKLHRIPTPTPPHAHPPMPHPSLLEDHPVLE